MAENEEHWNNYQYDSQPCPFLWVGVLDRIRSRFLKLVFPYKLAKNQILVSQSLNMATCQAKGKR